MLTTILTTIFKPKYFIILGIGILLVSLTLFIKNKWDKGIKYEELYNKTIQELDTCKEQAVRDSLAFIENGKINQISFIKLKNTIKEKNDSIKLLSTGIKVITVTVRKRVFSKELDTLNVKTTYGL